MYTAVTEGIQVTVTPAFLAERSDPDQDQYFWAYTIEILNRGPRLMQLIARHWLITDGNGKLEEVQGLGVVGEQPVLKPGETFRYTSGCPLATPTGIMAGTYTMTDEDGISIEIEIPAFSLDVPEMRRVLN
ncbi:Co2+/Mg2+ efflux protein ApaG [Lichenihabitans sp. Uapishka_5]|uniref:Co2+/Mg2+ efflux protein ApaG n=1 Tax=Lichenihabitans sp. Uapishka_5 TaxID=3037302 RepID=UPI0029E80B08|nr:Co2+/Mg2+ efflux protein ApaG [Lichenihabitans sp. Uapishka_5]MDX7949699.1 Co2+/Mg2+ efflux protein ApaG [Lichenihabitans sp. Uapishka_5]